MSHETLLAEARVELDAISGKKLKDMRANERDRAIALMTLIELADLRIALEPAP